MLPISMIGQTKRGNKITTRPFGLISLALTGLVLGLTWIQLPAVAEAAGPSSVVINEIMYNPASGVDGDEFLELYNTTASPISLSGWCFTNGVSMCFASGVTIAAHQYAVVSPDAGRTQATYNVTTVGTYSGKLDNGGEKVTLKDNNGVTISSLTYDDGSPWPISPDGSGPSLELLDATLDGTQASSWRGSLANGGTPGAINSVTNANSPRISGVNQPTSVTPGTTPTITAHVTDATSVSLVYKVMFDSDQTLLMYDDGAHFDGAAGDGVFGAMIPAQEAGKMVRYKISAINGNGAVTSPGSDDSISYLGYAIDDGTHYDIPLIRWYIEPSDYTDMTTNHLADDHQFPAVVAVGDQFFDNSRVRVKGQSSTSFAKRKYKFDLPAGYTLGSPTFDIPVKEFSVQVYFLNLNDYQEGLAWKAAEKFGFKPLQNRYVRVNRNDGSNPSQYIGHYLLIENYDKAWRERNDYQSGALYKQGNDKKTRLNEDNSDIQDLQTKVTTLQGDALKSYLLDNINIPALINFHAFAAVANHDDWYFYKNLYEYRDTEGTGRWEYLPWDLDSTFVTPTMGDADATAMGLKEPIMGLVKKQVTGVPDYYDNAIIEKAMYQFPEFREMFFRRSMNMYDQVWGNDQYQRWYDEFDALSRNSVADDLVVWAPAKKSIYQAIFPNGFPYQVPADFPFDFDSQHFFDYLDGYTPEKARQLYFYGADRYKAAVARSRSEGQLLGVQTSSQESRVQISEIHYRSQGSEDTEFVELHNTGSQAVDISGWRVEGIGFTLPQGSVLPADGYGVIVANDVAFRATHTSRLVLGQYSGHLPDARQALTLKNAIGTTINTAAYGTDGAWPPSADNQGYGLNPIRASANEVPEACRTSSADLGDTPNASWVQSHSSSCPDRNYQAAQRRSQGGVLAKNGISLAVVSGVCLATLVAIFLVIRRYGYGKIRSSHRIQ